MFSRILFVWLIAANILWVYFFEAFLKAKESHLKVEYFLLFVIFAAVTLTCAIIWVTIP